jgi:hypothetical protein
MLQQISTYPQHVTEKPGRQICLWFRPEVADTQSACTAEQGMLVAAAHTNMWSIVGLAICLLLLLHLKQDAHSKHMHRQTPADLNKTSSAASIPKHSTASDSCAG